MKFMYSILVSCLLCIGQAQAANFNLFDATSFDPQPVLVSAADNSVPVGTVIIWTKEQIPDGWLECDGQKVNEVLYPDLAALMPNTPNFQGMFLRGVGSQSFVQNNGGNIGKTNTLYSSANLGQIQGDSMREATFSVAHPSGFGDFSPSTLVYKDEGVYFNGIDGFHTGGWTRVYWKFSQGLPVSNEIRPVNIGVKYIIKGE